MRSSLITTLALTVLLSGCGSVRESAINPFNWFGRSEEAPAQTETVATNPLIPERSGLLSRRRAAQADVDLTTPIDQITGLTIERVPGGAIIRANGLDSYTTSYNARLRSETVDEAPENGTLIYTFRRRVPQAARPGGAEAAREITVARFVSDQTLRGVRQIRVEAGSNARSVRR